MHRDLDIALAGRIDRRPNKEIREEVEKSGLHFWEVAQLLRISESTLYRILRKPLTEAETEEFKRIIKEWERERAKSQKSHSI